MLLRKCYTIAKRAVFVHVGACALFVGMAVFAEDKVYRARFQSAHHATVKPTGFFSNVKVLTNEERKCLEAWLELMRFHVDPLGNMKQFSSNCSLNDTLMFFDGLSEITDGFSFLSWFYEWSTPDVVEVRRETFYGGEVCLHARLQTEAQVRWLPLRYTFASTVCLQLEDFGGVQVGAGSATTTVAANKRIRSAEHRWLGGPIVSRFIGTYQNVYGDMGDLLRRLNGFTLSTAVTNSEHLV